MSGYLSGKYEAAPLAPVQKHQLSYRLVELPDGRLKCVQSWCTNGPIKCSQCGQMIVKSRFSTGQHKKPICRTCRPFVPLNGRGRFLFFKFDGQTPIFEQDLEEYNASAEGQARNFCGDRRSTEYRTRFPQFRGMRRAL